MERLRASAPSRTTYLAPAVVNCAGAWSGQLPPHLFPTRPVKGQMLSVAGTPRDLLRHVVRAPEIYLVPRSDGRILVGATIEEAGYDKRTDVDTIQRMHRAAIDLVPALANARILESWAGLRPGSRRQSAHSRRDTNSRIFCCDWSLQGRNFADANHRSGDGASYHRSQA